MSPHLLVFGTLPRGPLAILRETWLGQRNLGESNSKVDVSAYLEGLLDRLQTAQKYAAEHAEVEQARHVRHYNSKSRDKQFVVGDKCLILQRDSSESSVFSRWKGPDTVVQVCSSYTYIVELNGGRYHMHANSLRKFNVRVEEVECKAVFCDAVNIDECVTINSCYVIYESDVDFGNIVVVDTTDFDVNGVLPSQKIAPDKLAHLSKTQQDELLSVLNKYATVFSEKPGLCTAVNTKSNYFRVSLLSECAPTEFRRIIRRRLTARCQSYCGMALLSRVRRRKHLPLLWC